MEFIYRTEGVCAKEINLTIDNGVIKKVAFTAGCNGNLQGISKLVEGMPIEAVIKKLEGITCGSKATSCPDQLSIALKSIL